MKIILVIPDGLIQNNFDFKISKTYQSALDLSIKESKLTSAIICLLPGNKFGSSNFEQFWAFNYLINKNIKPELILIGESKGRKYLTTRDNFLMAIKYGFRTYLENKKIFLNEQIINEVKKSGFFCIMSDETRDISNTEQAVICLRYVDRNFEAKEQFLG